MTTEREHSSLIGVYVRELHVIGLQRLKALEHGCLIGQRSKMEASEIWMPKQNTPETCGRQELF